ncbi:beta-lactamase family protein [Robiginitalea sp.]|nr:beta-lactamase family protein [Robiginitalea sp.]
MEQVQRVLQNLIDWGDVPGLAIQVNCKGKVRMQKGFGLADIDTERMVHPGLTQFRAGSISKPITATALNVLLQEGIIDLEEKVSHFVPEFRYSEVSIRNLVGHTSGIRSYRGKELLSNAPISALESLVLFKDDPLMFAPSSDFLYSTYNFVLLALAIERATGEPFETLVRNRVLAPLGMNMTAPEVPESPFAGCSQFYSRDSSGFNLATPVDNRYKLGGGGYLTTVVDLCLLGQSYVDQYLRNEPAADSFLQPQQLNGQWVPYGLGWQLAPINAKRRYFGHDGTGIGGFGSFYVFPDLELVIALLFNCTRPKIQEQLSITLEHICTTAERDWLQEK